METRRLNESADHRNHASSKLSSKTSFLSGRTIAYVIAVIAILLVIFTARSLIVIISWKSTRPVVAQAPETSTTISNLQIISQNNSINESADQVSFVEDSLRLLEMTLNRSVDPCENFYNFACDKINKWPEWLPIRQKMIENVDDYLKQILEKSDDDDDGQQQQLSILTATLQKARFFYRTCLENEVSKELCLPYTRDYFEFPLAHAVLDHFQLLNQSEDICQLVKQSLIDTINENVEISIMNKSKMIHRLSEVKIELGIVSEFVDKQNVARLYDQVNLAGKSYQEMNYQFDQVLNEKRTFQDSFYPYAVYLADENVVFLPPVLLKYANFNWSDPFNYGSFGSVVGGKLSEVFTAKELRKWWSVGFKYFLQGAKGWSQFPNLLNQQFQCLADQLGMESVNKGAAFADQSALKIAFRALGDKIGQDTLERFPFENLNLTNQQIFFIAFSHSKCSREESSMLNTLKNSIEFSQAFNCSIGTPMNPVEKCQIW